MTRCIDEKVGALLHAYELKTLSEEESEKFEIHLLHCDYCFNRVAEFEKYASAMRKSEKLKASLAESHRPDERRKKMWLLKPGFLYFLIILMAIPAVYGIIKFFDKDLPPGDKAGIGPAQEINPGLIQPGLNGNTFTISSGRGGIINFASGKLTGDYTCLVIIADESGKEIARFDNFSNFDDQGVGRLIIPNESMQSGDYWLIVKAITADSAGEPVKYRFKIVR